MVVYLTDIRKEEGTFLLFPRKRGVSYIESQPCQLTIYFDPDVTSLMRLVEGQENSFSVPSVIFSGLNYCL